MLSVDRLNAVFLNVMAPSLSLSYFVTNFCSLLFSLPFSPMSVFFLISLPLLTSLFLSPLSVTNFCFLPSSFLPLSLFLSPTFVFSISLSFFPPLYLFLSPLLYLLVYSFFLSVCVFISSFPLLSLCLPLSLFSPCFSHTFLSSCMSFS